jgi:hypothetical protein
VGELADDPAPEQQHADHKNRALDDEHPLTNRGQIVFQRDHEEEPLRWRRAVSSFREHVEVAV